MLAEGPHLYEEALRTGARVHAVVATEEPAAVPRGARLLLVTEKVFAGLSGTESPQGVLALVEPPRWSVSDLGPGPVLALDGVQDPGNAGTLLRAAEAFGAGGLMFLPGTVSPWNEKVLRASAGSVFRMPVIAGARVEDVLALGRTVYGAAAEGGADPAACDLRAGAVIAIGSEGRGLSAAMRAAARPLRIPTTGVESLNAGVAGAILLYEAARQRRNA